MLIYASFSRFHADRSCVPAAPSSSWIIYKVDKLFYRGQLQHLQLSFMLMILDIFLECVVPDALQVAHVAPYAASPSLSQAGLALPAGMPLVVLALL